MHISSCRDSDKYRAYRNSRRSISATLAVLRSTFLIELLFLLILKPLLELTKLPNTLALFHLFCVYDQAYSVLHAVYPLAAVLASV